MKLPPARFTLRQFDGDELNVSREADTATRYSVGAEARLEVSLRSKTRGLANRRLETFWGFELTRHHGHRKHTGSPYSGRYASQASGRAPSISVIECQDHSDCPE